MSPQQRSWAVNIAVVGERFVTTVEKIPFFVIVHITYNIIFSGQTFLSRHNISNYLVHGAVPFKLSVQIMSFNFILSLFSEAVPEN